MFGTKYFSKRPAPIAGTRSIRRLWPYAGCLLAGMALVLISQVIIRPRHLETEELSYYAPQIPLEVPAWGMLKQKTLMLERPAEIFTRYPATRIEWRFADTTPAQVLELLGSLGLASTHLAALQDKSNWEISTTSVLIHPPMTVVRDMDALPRQRLYEALARTPENLAQRFPYVFRGTFEEWMAGSKLPAHRIEEIRRTIFKKGDVSIFADLPYFQLTAPSNEVFELNRIVSRVPTIIMGLALNEYSDLPDLRRYWLAGNGNADLNPLLASMSRVPGGSTINVNALLPPFARLLLNSYPQQRADFPDNANCVWSSMNFFSQRPDNHFVEERYTDHVLQTQYHPVPKASALGDIIMLYRPQSDGGMGMIHMCVFVADDVVFTKNGGDVYQPWVLMRLPDVQALFVNEPIIKTTVFRRNHRS